MNHLLSQQITVISSRSVSCLEQGRARYLSRRICLVDHGELKCTEIYLQKQMLTNYQQSGADRNIKVPSEDNAFLGDFRRPSPEGCSAWGMHSIKEINFRLLSNFNAFSTTQDGVFADPAVAPDGCSFPSRVGAAHRRQSGIASVPTM